MALGHHKAELKSHKFSAVDFIRNNGEMFTII